MIKFAQTISQPEVHHQVWSRIRSEIQQELEIMRNIKMHQDLPAGGTWVIATQNEAKVKMSSYENN